MGFYSGFKGLIKRVEGRLFQVNRQKYFVYFTKC